MKLIIGTAQFGFDYGVTNKRGKIPKNESYKILDIMRNNDIFNLDTASGYGNAEEILGNYRYISDFNVTTKVAYKSGDIFNQVNQSLKNLKKSFVHTILLHDYANLDEKEKKQGLVELRRIREKGWCKRIGISVYEPKDTMDILNRECIDVIQVPINIFNQSFISTGELERIKKIGITIQVRSIFMQGLALSHSLPESLNFASDVFNKFLDCQRKNNILPINLCVNFIKKTCDQCEVIFAVDSVDQLKEILIAFENALQIDVDYKEFESKDSLFINPVNWKIDEHQCNRTG